MSTSDYVDTPTKETVAYDTPPALIALTLTVLVVCFVAFSILFLCRYCCVSVTHTWTSGSIVRLSPPRSPPRGLDASLLQSFPTFSYASVKDLRKDKNKNYSLECAICLLEFEDDSVLRLLTVCCHVFHQECIDLWLGSHKTCPICRTELEMDQKSQDPGGMVCHIGGDEVRIDVRDDEEELEEGGRDHNRHEEHEGDDEESVKRIRERSHSTGHSIIMVRGRGGDDGDEGSSYDDDKYTLRLPRHVLRGVHHNYTRSLASYKDMAAGPPAPCSNCGFVQPPVSASSSHAQES